MSWWFLDRVPGRISWVKGTAFNLPESLIDQCAEDATQEAFIRAYQNIHTVYGTTFKSWLLRITTNVCIDMLRRLKKRPTTSLEPTDEDGEEVESAFWMADPGPSTEAAIESREMVDTIHDCLAHLQPALLRQRTRRGRGGQVRPVPRQLEVRR